MMKGKLLISPVFSMNLFLPVDSTLLFKADDRYRISYVSKARTTFRLLLDLTKFKTINVLPQYIAHFEEGL